MNDAINDMLGRYALTSVTDMENALKEIIQEIALLGLWRAHFFEHAAFYGGTALRILYQLDRFSEDLDFTLLKPDSSFSLSKYHAAVVAELKSFGFEVSITEKEKQDPGAIQSAFIKAETRHHLLEVRSPKAFTKGLDPKKTLKIKFEVDTDPPPGFSTEVKYLLQPTEFFVKACAPGDLFAGKLHAVLCRKWKTRVKGRDWYDLIWFIKRNIPVHIAHLEQRMIQTGHWKSHQPMSSGDLQKLLQNRIKELDIQQALVDIKPFIRDSARLKIWSTDFFLELISRLKTN